MPKKSDLGKIKLAKENYEFPKNADQFYSQIQANEVHTITVEAAGLEMFGINRFDIVLYRQTSVIDEHRLTVWQKTGEDDVQVGFAFDNFGDISIDLGDGDIARFKKKEIMFIGEVVGIIKPFGAQKSSEETELEIERETIEVTLTCSQCKKEIIGNKKFLLAQGWESRGDEWICLNCGLFN